MTRPVPVGCGWRIWQEDKEPRQWIGMCGDGTACRGGARMNARADVQSFWDGGQKWCPRERPQ